MIYTVPEYYNQFQCLASACPATCCAGWQIVIDEKTQEKYRNYKGSFGNRLKNSIDWKDGTFQQYHGRCAFLNEENLCDIHIEAGHDALCRTCRRYPKHVEVYENEREVSLSLSCPAAARLIMGQKQPCRFRSIEKSGEESERDFDEFLYSALQDCRKVMLTLVQDRSVPLQLRMARILALAHDVQNRIERNRVFEVETVLERYQRPQARELLDAKLCRFAEHSKQQQGARAWLEDWITVRWRMLDLFREFEVLDPLWTEDLQMYRRCLYEKGCATYLDQELQWTERSEEWETEYEQILVYFLFTYFCGAVYDGDVMRKVQMAVESVLILSELGMAAWMQEGTMPTFEDRMRLAWRYSRELEHSDPNLAAMERVLGEWPEYGFEPMLLQLLAHERR